MTRPGLPLSIKLLLWLLLNLVLLFVLFAFTSGQSGFGWQSLLSVPVRERLFTIGQGLGRELSTQPQAQWPALLDAYGQRYGVRFECCRARGGPEHGPPPGPPPGAGDRPPPPDGGPAPQGRPDDARFDGPPPPDDQNPAHRIELRHTGSDYQLRVPTLLGAGNARAPADLIITAASLQALIVFLGLQHWLLLPLLGALLSVLWWLPLLAALTRTVARITAATARIAEGRFDARVAVTSRDELGQLSEAVNRMAARLQQQADAQRRFMADIAHEVTAPLSRLQIGLGILDAGAGAGEAERAQLQDLHDDAAEMSELLRELLLFSRADAEFAQRALPTRFLLRPLLDAVAQRDDGGGRVRIVLDADIELCSHRAFLQRALSNLVRNALRYGGDAGPIELRAMLDGEQIEIAVLDRGPGVPEAALARLGEPFFRPEGSRSRDSGGFGLGLAIVRRCIAACDGSVDFRNRRDAAQGFEACLRLPREIAPARL
ncbi:HAMP domain-containing sensor histidine kinase [Solimonas terrae]|uniref:histidine kinase n=1 Tax=Solimonas terrae TaxID=1396819 RepID=A0A6M2BW65_9GAMM|nr:HAMP domain-containing sensor histidine kinase [Solimonas terrae]NGY06383.1 HAMP domain-containing histidine kinase [Solimonas terrae]